MLCPRPTDAEVDANAAIWAAELLAHPLAPTLPEEIRLRLAAIMAGAWPGRPEDARRMIWLAASHLDAVAIRAALGWRIAL
jgi:hypothetical protein